MDGGNVSIARGDAQHHAPSTSFTTSQSTLARVSPALAMRFYKKHLHDVGGVSLVDFQAFTCSLDLLGNELGLSSLPYSSMDGGFDTLSPTEVFW